MLPDDEGGPPGYKAFGTISDGGVQKTVWGRSFPCNDHTHYVDWAIQASWKDIQGAQWNGGKQLDEASAKAIVVEAFGHDSTVIIKTEKADRSSMEMEKKPKLEPSSPTTITSPTPGGRPALKREFDEIDSDSASPATLPISGHSEPSEHYHERGATTLPMANTRAWVNAANHDSGSGIGSIASMPNPNGPASVGDRHRIDALEEASPSSQICPDIPESLDTEARAAMLGQARLRVMESMVDMVEKQGDRESAPARLEKWRQECRERWDKPSWQLQAMIELMEDLRNIREKTREKSPEGLFGESG